MPSQKASIQMGLKGWIYTTIKQCPQHTFLFLTKNPERLKGWESFPDNCWVGVTATDSTMFAQACGYLSAIPAKVKYISIEPLLDWWIDFGEIYMSFLKMVDWLIIGAQTKPYKPPEIEWVKEIVEACDKAGIPVFLKESLKPLLATKECFGEKYVPLPFGDDNGYLRQELPSTS